MLLDELRITERADFPHDNYWTQATVTFSDGSRLDIPLVKSRKPQSITFPPRRVRSLVLSQLIQAEGPSPFPAPDQIEAWGYECLEGGGGRKMSWFDAIYGRPGRGVDPNEPEKKGLARFAQMLGRDFGQLIATNFLVCILILPAALGVSSGGHFAELSLYPPGRHPDRAAGRPRPAADGRLLPAQPLQRPVPLDVPGGADPSNPAGRPLCLWAR